MLNLPGTPPTTALPPGTRLARLVRVDRSAYDVRTEQGPRRLPALPPERDATVGDWLAIDDEQAVALLPRTSLLTRGASSGVSRPQSLAANVDVVLVCSSLGTRVPVRRIERLLALVWESGATPVVVLTKSDLHPDPVLAVAAVQPHAPGVDVLAVDAASGEVDLLGPYAEAGTTLALLGASGAGKSTIVNALAGRELMSTGDVRHVDGKGRHTTTHRELVELPTGAVVIDTPGLRGVALSGSEEGLARAFLDVEELAAACRFTDCGHHGEPGCAVQASLDAGDITQVRMESWRHLQRELAWQARRTDARLRQQEKQRWKVIHLQQRAGRGRRA